MSSEKSPFLWQNIDRTITLIDIPYSISAAQDAPDSETRDTILSCEPLAAPYNSNEPKSAAARERLKGMAGDALLSEEYADLLGRALEEVHDYHQGNWCLPRTFEVKADARHIVEEESSNRDPKAFADLQYSSPPVQDDKTTLTDLLTQVCQGSSSGAWDVKRDSHCPDCDHEDVRFHCNCGNNTTKLQISTAVRDGASSDDQAAAAAAAATFTFNVPPNSTFALLNVAEARAFHAFVRNQAQAHDTRRHFDFILLDPPWPNHSARRIHRKSPSVGYRVEPALADVSAQLLATDLDMLIPPAGLVGVWITNRPAVRKAVLGAATGLFAAWGLVLEEEWLWLKTTARGRPVLPLDGLWRKPYEVLLLGRRPAWPVGAVAPPPYRRVLVGVPDLHSRKPCLKGLVEPLLLDDREVRVLEVYARNLVAGWWSWGDECIKHNWTGAWRSGASAA